MTVAAISTHPNPAVAVGEVIGELLEGLVAPATLVVVFATEHHRSAMGRIGAAIRELLHPGAVIGAAAAGVLANGYGVKGGPGLAVWATTTRLPALPFRLRAESSGDTVHFSGFDPALLDGRTTMLLLADPFTFPLDDFLGGLHGMRPDLTVTGGLVSAARAPGDNRLMIGDRVVNDGAVGVLLDPPDAPVTVVSQGCRPIGAPFTVTAASGTMLRELAGKPALQRVQEVLRSLDDTDRELAAAGLQLGIVTDQRRLDFSRGDFLIRGVLGADRETGALAVGDQVELGDVVQLQVRDPATAGDDLRLLLMGHEASGALVFTCNGRGASMFGDAHHDADIVHEHLGRSASAGMFCAGEIGPVGGRNAVHAFTASVALFTG
ncbi:MAG: FIST N-terminal domain-containing protein [Ilumatobacteraceae bacterium]